MYLFYAEFPKQIWEEINEFMFQKVMLRPQKNQWGQRLFPLKQII